MKKILCIILVAAAVVPMFIMSAAATFEGMYIGVPEYVEPSGYSAPVTPTFPEGMTVIKGIDVSKWNGDIDWKKVKADGIEFAMLRAGYGNDEKYMDVYFQEYAKEATEAGIKIGVYWFSYALNEEEARQEAEVCLKIIKDYNITYPVAYDFEYASQENYEKKMGKLSKTTASAFARVFLETVKDAGYTPMLYTNYDFSSQWFESSLLTDYDLWWASWNRETPPNAGQEIWQSTDSGTVDGITTAVDLDYSFVDYAANSFFGLKEAELKEKYGEIPEGYLVKYDDTDRIYSYRDGGWRQVFNIAEEEIDSQNELVLELGTAFNGKIQHSENKQAYYINVLGKWSSWEPVGIPYDELKETIEIHNRISENLNSAVSEGDIYYFGETRRYYLYTNSLFSPLNYVNGDVTGEGKVNIADCMMLFSLVGSGIGDPAKFVRGDVNRNGVTNILDSMLLYQYVSGSLKTLD